MIASKTATGFPPAKVPRVTKPGFAPFAGLSLIFSGASRFFKAPVTAFCDLATCDRFGLVSLQGDYATVIRLDGMRRLASTKEIEASAQRLRQALGGMLETPGHAIQFFYTADPDGVSAAIDRSLDQCRAVTRALNASFDDVFSERQRVLPPYLRQERACIVLWTRPARLSKQELKQASRRRGQFLQQFALFGDAQNPYLGSEELGTVHQTAVRALLGALSAQNVRADALDPREGLKLIRDELYPDTIGTDWTPQTPLDPPRGHMPEDILPEDLSDMLWPPLREQIFTDAAITSDFFTARLGQSDWTPIDLTEPPEVELPFAELAGDLAHYRMPWRTCATIEGVPPGYMMWKEMLATLLNMGSNAAIHSAFEQIKTLRKQRLDTIVKFRMSFATRAPAGQEDMLRLRGSRLQSAIAGWGKAGASRICGDPLAGTLSSVPGLAVASTAPPAEGPLSNILTMMPWNRPGGPWRNGSVLFRNHDGCVVPFDPSGSGRDARLDLFVGPSRRGKSLLDNVLLLGTCFSPAALTTDGARLPLIGKVDIGDGTSGLIDVIHSAMRPEDHHLAVHVPFSLTDEHAYNIFDTETCCREPLDYHKTFLVNFLNLVCKPLDGPPFEGMNQLLNQLITALYDLFSDVGVGSRPKPYRPGVESIDTAIRHQRIQLPANPTWWNVADAFAAAGDMRQASAATKYAVPVLSDLFEAARLARIENVFRHVTPAPGESVIALLSRYLGDFIDKYPTLNMPTRLDISDARIRVIDIDRVAPEGEGEAQRRSELMYLLGFQIVSRDFFLRPEDADKVPDHVRPWHQRRFIELRESFKRLECDEYQRAAAAPFVQRQFEEAARRAAKLNVGLGLASQKLTDYSDYLISQSTGRFLLGAGDVKEADEMADRFGLSNAARAIVRDGLTGPRQDGSGSPFLLQILVNSEWYELYLVNLVGPIELWALSTNPRDAALRRRLYESLGSTEARRRLAKVFPRGSAISEIDRRTDTRLRRGEAQGSALGGVIDELASEIRDGVGLGTVVKAE